MIKFRNVFLLLTTCGVLLTGEAPVLAATAPFKPGEVIHYNVKQLALKAGDATLAFKGDSYLEGKKYTLIVFTAKGFNFYDEERIYLDPGTWLPLKVMRDLDIFGNKENIMEEYDQALGMVRITKVANGKTTIQAISKTGPIENLYGFLYRTRLAGPVKVGQSLALRLPTVDVRLEGIQSLKFNAAGDVFAAVMMKSVPSKYTIWFDLSDRCLPLRIAGALGMSNTVMTMTGVTDEGPLTTLPATKEVKP